MATKTLEKIDIGGLSLANPLIFGPHRLNFPEGHLPGARRIAYYEERARHGVGMIVTEAANVLPGEYPFDWALNVYEENAVSAYRKLAEAIHKYPTRVVGQLNLYGGQGDSSVTRLPLLAPSPVPEVNTNEIPKVIDADDLAAIKAGFAHGAKVYLDAGLDGVEINAGQFSLLRQFMSGLTNFRSDEYGGSLENKCRLTVEVLQAVRELIGDRVLGLRLCADEYAPWGGIQPSEAKQIAEYIISQVRPDYIAFENGSIYSVNMTMAGCNQPEDYALAAAQEAGAELSIPRAVGGSLVSPSAVAAALESFELVDITRALIADPLWIEKVKAGEEHLIVPCILCKQGCHTYANTNPVISCSVNPLAGIESKRSPIVSSQPRRLAVVGSGPAGLNATLQALQVGHRVVLFERAAALGGHFGAFARSFGPEYPQRLFTYFEQSFAPYQADGRLEIRLETEFSAEQAADFEAVVVATGAAYTAGTVPGDAAKLDLDRVLAGDIPTGERAVVVDNLGDNRAVVACRLLAAAGYQVTLVTAEPYQAGKLVKLGEFGAWYGELAALGIVERSNSHLRSAAKAKLEIVNKYNDEVEELPGVDVYLEIDAPAAETGLWQQIQRRGVPCICIGDAVAPRSLQAAMREGFEAISELR